MYHPFVLPFSLGLAFLIAFMLVKFGIWFFRFTKQQKNQFFRGVFSFRIFKAMGEIVAECLLHRRMYKVNKVLGYMHMSFAFGWFMLIAMGNFETRLLSGPEFNPPYYPIFFKYFEMHPINWKYAEFFNVMMDVLLLYVLSGFVLALSKRFYSRIVGMKKTTRQRWYDRVALTSLWLIFPIRYLAESFTSGIYGNGSFFTGPSGSFFASFLPVDQLMMPAWWAYSLSLGVFFVSVPFSRYMHIPTEIFLIAVRRFGLIPSREYDVISEVEVNSCPRCGVCIDVCQISSGAGIHNIQTVYLAGDIRYDKVKDDMVMNCLMCGRCKEYCPVGIHTDNLRMTQRTRLYDDASRDFSYLKLNPSPAADLVYFAGCMTHLTTGIKHAMTSILKQSGENYMFLDENGSVCCGRPLMLAGELESARVLMQQNTELIKASGAHTLVTSCPICYKVFKDDYQLDIKVMHHSQYLLQAIQEGKIHVSSSDSRLVYHDPCDLGRGCGEYEASRDIIRASGHLTEAVYTKNKSLCCGGALGNFELSYSQREEITNNALSVLLADHPDGLITACPLCKKTFAKSADCPVMDISELVLQSVLVDVPR